MQEHPVPQNVTQFEFKLVGDMTIKQFGYVGAGLGIAYLIFTVMAASVPFLAYPLMVVSALTGVALAFLPFQDRMLDHWIKAYFQAIFAPTYGKYSSKTLRVSDEAFKKRLQIYTHEGATLVDKVAPAKLGSEAQQAPATQALVGEKASLPEGVQPKEVQVTIQPPTPGLNNPQPPTPPAVQSPPPTPISTRDSASPANPDKENEARNKTDLSKVVKYAEEAQILQQQIQDAQKELETIKKRASNPQENVASVSAEFKQVLAKLETFNNQARIIRDELNRMTNTGSDVEVMQPQSMSSAPTVKISSEKLEKYSSLSTFPNILNGIVCDPKGNLLAGVIVVTHDKDGLPVRALKTNKLGQFLAATPLPNGVYTLTFEKEDLQFDVVEIELSGNILPAVKVNAKGGA